MKTLTITISDATARRLAETAAGSHRPQEEVAAQAIEETFGPDWFDELDDQSRAAIVAGVAEADREEFASDAAVAEAFARFKRREFASSSAPFKISSLSKPTHANTAPAAPRASAPV